jgi:hypothetical protein
MNIAEPRPEKECDSTSVVAGNVQAVALTKGSLTTKEKLHLQASLRSNKSTDYDRW